jgi:DNA-binding LacI/PurR family transcriptional regulator
LAKQRKLAATTIEIIGKRTYFVQPTLHRPQIDSQMKKGITLKDIACKLNMSISTVSKALSGDVSISKATKERVQKIAGEWNYIPNEAARHFKLNKTFTLGLIIPDLLDQFFVLAVNGVEEVAAFEKYNVIVSQSHEDIEHENQIVDIMFRNRVDGVIVAITKNTDDMSSFRKLIDIGIPVVFFARSPLDPSFNYVSANNEDGAMKAMEFLFKKGHKQIAHFMGPASMSVSQIRYEGYVKALEKHHVRLNASFIKEVDFTPASTYKAMSSLMKLKSPPTAIFTFKNYISLDVIQYLKKYNPAEVNTIDVVGFGNLPLFQYLDHKPAASIDENSYTMGIEAARLLFSSMKLETPEQTINSQHIKVPCKLVIHQ